MKHTFLLFPEFKDKAITLSYDDGTVTDKRLTEIADTYGLKCTFNICSECFAEKGGNDKFTRSEAFEFYGRSGHEVAACITRAPPFRQMLLRFPKIFLLGILRATTTVRA